ncbi:MAG: hypothetical protein HWQ38_37480 [Nostoc sp. NMS7]|uniref:hypothetical protein n=1 Tax=Nostoc sp. NMS7 TaxID=2815391 RepID=UPI0025FE85ED|nr:hypothetical protein [Nostoc sp. NMS7]MBN3951853.1 hypothetical protein [Nostoc sp. NMS7]
MVLAVVFPHSMPEEYELLHLQLPHCQPQVDFDSTTHKSKPHPPFTKGKSFPLRTHGEGQAKA